MPADGIVQGRALTDSIAVAFHHFAQRSANGFIVPEWLPTPGNRAYLDAVATLDKYVYELINTRRSQLTGGRTDTAAAASTSTSSAAAAGRQDLLTALVLARDEDGSVMADQGVRDELMTLLVAGQETSAILLSWTVAFCAWHPAVQEAAASEVQVLCQWLTLCLRGACAWSCAVHRRHVDGLRVMLHGRTSRASVGCYNGMCAALGMAV